MQRVSVQAVQGNTRVNTAGVLSTTLVEGSFPGCTVSVFTTGTTNLATIYGDNLNPPTPKSNPFTADATGSGFFYALNGSRVDIQLSGTGIVTPFILAGDVLLYDSALPVISAPQTVAFSATPQFDLSLAAWFKITLTGNVTGPTFPNAEAGSLLVLTIIQDPSGGHTWAWPGSFVNPPAPALGSNARTECVFKFDGSTWTMFAATGDQLQANGGTLAGTYAGNPTFSGAITSTSITNTGAILSKTVEQTRYADQFSGADMGAKINAAIADLPSSGGIVDATAFQGAQSASATITLNKPVLLKLGGVTLTVAGSPGISLTAQGAAVAGLSPMATVLITSSGTADIVQCGNTFNNVSSLGFRASGARTGGAAINLAANSGGTSLRHLRIDKTYNGIVCNSSSGTGNVYIEDISMGAGLSATGNWNLGIYLGNVASGTVASFHFDGVRIIGDASFAGAAMVLLDSGCDTILFSNSEFVQGGSSNICVLAQGNNTGQNPSWVRFSNCVFEAGTAAQALDIQKATDWKFVNCNIATSLVGIFILCASAADVKDFRFENSTITTCQQQGVFVAAASSGGVYIVNNWIADTSQQTNGGFNAVQITGACSNFIVANNKFGLSGVGSGFLPFVDVAVAAAGSDSFEITGNILTQGLSDSSTGTNKFIHSNIGSTLNIFNGVPVAREVATVDLTAQTAAVGTTTLYAVPSAGAGQYRLSWDAKVTTAAGTSSTLGALTIVYTDPDGVVQTITAPATVPAGTIATTNAGNTTTSSLIGMPLTLNCKASTNITYAMAYVSNAANAMTYNLHIKLEAM